MKSLPVANLAFDEIENLKQFAAYIQEHWRTLNSAKGWAQIPKPEFGLTTTLRTTGSIQQLVPSGSN
jgi:hypothetical protein